MPSPLKSRLVPPRLSSLKRQESSALLISDSVYDDSLSDSDGEMHSPRVVDLSGQPRESSASKRLLLNANGLAMMHTKGKVEESAPAADDTTSDIIIPQEFKDPITGHLMLKPVQTIHGQIYEFDNIEAWFQNNDTDPITKALVTDKKVVDAKMVKGKIDTFLERYPSVIRDASVFVLPRTLLDELALIMATNPIDDKTRELLKVTVGRFMDAFVRPNHHNKQNIMHMLAEHASFDVFRYVTSELMTRQHVWLNLIPELVFQRDHYQQTPLNLAFTSNDYRILLYMLSYLRPIHLKRAITILIGKKNKKALDSYVEKASESQYQNLITDIIRLDSNTMSLTERKLFYRDKKVEILNENAMLKQMQEIMAQIK